MANGSRSITTRSARLPSVIEPSSSSTNAARAPLIVYASSMSCSVTRCCGVSAGPGSPSGAWRVIATSMPSNGSIELTFQSLPATSTPPARFTDAIGYSHSERTGPITGTVSSVM
jgi:hypothetical protein